MSHIKTVRHDIGSLFQSMVDDVARRIDQRKGQTNEEHGTTEGKRPNINHPIVAVAHRIAEHWEAGKEPPETAPADLQAKHGGVVQSLWNCAKLAGEAFWAKLRKKPNADQLHDELKFSTCDPEWAEAIIQYEEYFGLCGDKNQIPYVRYGSMDDFVLPSLPPNARIALIGDWGTGTDDARGVLEQVASHKPDVLIHLGDIYYSGTPDECQKYFLDLIDDVFDRASHPIPVYTLTGNHDMYDGGVGYYGLLPQLNPGPTYAADQAQGASYFALRSVNGSGNGAWQILGMDTGLHDSDPFTVSKDVTYLDPQEEEWHVDKVREFSAGGGRTILLSHHQLFSAFDGIGDYASRPDGARAVNPHLMETYGKLVAAAQEAKKGEAGNDNTGASPIAAPIAAWFWGHEHNLCIYQPYAGLEKGRCIGHGAIPTFLDADPYAVLDNLGSDPPKLVASPDDPSKSVELAADDQVYAHGFVILELDDSDRSAVATYYQETSEEPLYRETL